jgi:large repetitive protein
MGRLGCSRLAGPFFRALTVLTTLLLVMPSALATAQPPIPLSIETISPAMLTVGQEGLPYSDLITATGGIAPYHWSATGLPEGLTIRERISSTSVSTAAIRGTSEEDGRFAVNVKVTDSSGQESDENLELEVTGPYMTVPSPVLDDAIAGEAYDASIGVIGGLPLLHFVVSINTDIPPGLSVDSAGAVVGTPTTPGQYKFVVFVTDSSYFPEKIAPTIYITVAARCSKILATPPVVNMCVG